MKIRSALLGIAAAGLTASALALPPTEPPPEPPPEPPKLNDCSPGFWKNHQEYWAEGQYCADDMCVEDVMTRLTAKGKGSGDIRHDMAATLNAFADSYYQALICLD
jgi:hypothetical protein